MKLMVRKSMNKALNKKLPIAFVRAVCKHIMKTVYCLVSFPGCQIPKFWVGKASQAQQNDEKKGNTGKRAGSLQIQPLPHISSRS